MSVEQKRMALRAFIRRIIWDGEKIYIVTFGDTESEIDYTDLLREKAEPNRGDSERNTYVFPQSEKNRAGCFYKRPD